jgi:hypothetical protein
MKSLTLTLAIASLSIALPSCTPPIYYRGRAGQPFTRDGAGHFRHGVASGFRGVHTSGARR